MTATPPSTSPLLTRRAAPPGSELPTQNAVAIKSRSRIVFMGVLAILRVVLRYALRTLPE